MAIASLVAGLIGMLTMWPTSGGGFGEPSGSYELALACVAWGVAAAVMFWVMAAVLNWMAALYELLSQHLGHPESASEGRHSVPPA